MGVLTLVAASVVAGDAASEVNGTSSVIRACPHNEHDTGSMEIDDPQGAGQVAPVVSISVFGEAHLSIAECSPEKVHPAWNYAKTIAL